MQLAQADVMPNQAAMHMSHHVGMRAEQMAAAKQKLLRDQLSPTFMS